MEKTEAEAVTKKEYDISVCLAAIRKDNWETLYNSVVQSVGDYSFELIFCGPYAYPPAALKNLDNVRCIRDFGPPTRAQQRSMSIATGRYITWAADDGWFLEQSLSECIKELDDNLLEKKCIVGRYIEGEQDGLGEKDMYYINKHRDIRSPLIPDHFLIFNCVVLPTQYFKDLGGFDCRFEVCPLAFVDFGARAQFDGIQISFKNAIFQCTHSPGHTGDHGPVHDAQQGHDCDIYKQIWNTPAPNEVQDIHGNVARIKIDFDNWLQVPEVWIRRFSAEDVAEANKLCEDCEVS